MNILSLHTFCFAVSRYDRSCFGKFSSGLSASLPLFRTLWLLGTNCGTLSSGLAVHQHLMFLLACLWVDALFPASLVSFLAYLFSLYLSTFSSKTLREQEGVARFLIASFWKKIIIMVQDLGFWTRLPWIGILVLLLSGHACPWANNLIMWQYFTNEKWRK